MIKTHSHTHLSLSSRALTGPQVADCDRLLAGGRLHQVWPGQPHRLLDGLRLWQDHPGPDLLPGDGGGAAVTRHPLGGRARGRHLLPPGQGVCGLWVVFMWTCALCVGVVGFKGLQAAVIQTASASVRGPQPTRSCALNPHPPPHPPPQALCLACGSDPDKGTAKKMGAYVMKTCFQTTTISSSMCACGGG